MMGFIEWLSIMGSSASIIGIFLYFAAKHNGRATRTLIQEINKKTDELMQQNHSDALAILDKIVDQNIDIQRMVKE